MGGNSSRGLHSGAGVFGLGVSAVCAGGVCGSLCGVGVPCGVKLLAAVCAGCRGRGAVSAFGRRVYYGCVWMLGRVGEARVAGPGAARDGGRVWAAGWRVGGEGQGQGQSGRMVGWVRMCCVRVRVRL